jgi:hypothetical protein
MSAYIGVPVSLPSSGNSFLLYLYLARRLRIADRRATSLSAGEP